MFDWIMDFIRSFLFSIAMLFSWISDQLYLVLKTVSTLNIDEYENLWTWYGLLLVFIIVCVFFRVVVMFIKASFDEEYRDRKYNPLKVFTGMFLIAITISIFPIVTKYAISSSVYITEKTSLFLNAEIDNINPSDIIITNSVNGLKDTEKGSVNGEEESYTMEEINKNLNLKEDGKYRYFPELWHILFIGGVMIVFGMGIVLLTFQYAKRFYSIMSKILISPIPISSLIENDSDKFSMWLKMLLSDLITNFIQFLLLFVVLLSASSSFIIKKGFFVSVILLIAGIFFILEGVPQVTQLIGGDMSTGGVIQQLSSIRMATRGTGHSLKKGLAFGTGVAATTAAAGIYGAGRATGGKSILMDTIKQMNEQSQDQQKVNTKPKENYFEHGVETSGNSSTTEKLSRDGTLANRFSNYANDVGGGANLIHTGAKHLYQKSANRLAKNKWIATGAKASNSIKQHYQTQASNKTNMNQAEAMKQSEKFTSPDLDYKKSKRFKGSDLD